MALLLKGMFKSEYQGHPYARLLCTEPFKNPNGRGINFVVLKLDLNEYERLKDDFDLYSDQEVALACDRYGRVMHVDLAD